MNFSLHFNPFALISLVTVVIVTLLIWHIARQKYQTATLRWLIAVMVAILMWSLAEFLIRISGNVYTAQLFKYWEIAGYVLLGPTAVGLSLAFARKESILMQSKLLWLLFAPAALFIFLVWMQNGFVPFNKPEAWHQAWYGDWVASLSPVFTFGFIPWLNLLLLFAIIQIARYYRSLTSKSKKRQAKILLVGVVAPTLIGLITDQLFETLTGLDGLELATLTTCLSGLWVTYGILKYQLFEVNPASISTNILNAMPEGVIVCNPRWEIEYVSPPVKNLLGYEPNQLLGQSIDQYITHGWEELGQISLQKDAPLASVEVTIANARHQAIPMAITPTRYEDAGRNLLAFVLILVDLRQMRELLHVTQERDKLQATLSSITDGIIGISNNSTIALANNALGSMFGLNQEELLNHRFDKVFELQDASSSISLDLALSKINTSQQERFNNITAVAHNGKRLEINLIISRLPQESQVDLAAIVTIQNVSRERQLDKLKANFTFLATHELRTPLTSIRGYLHLLKEEINEQLSPSNRKLLDRVVTSTDQLNQLISRLLEVSDIEQQRLKLNKKVLPWDEFLATCMTTYQNQADQEGWHLTVQNLPTSIMVNFDPDRLAQVFSILLTNALQYAEGVANITVATQIEDGAIVTRITDQGAGMSPELLNQLFVPFSRADTGFKQTKQGIGLSLFIAKTIIEMHGGTITAQSALHHGSTFTISLPVEPIPALPSLDI